MTGRESSGVSGRIARLASRLGAATDAVGRYDLLLAVIPAALVGAALVGIAFGIPVERALLGGAVVASLALFDGLFRRPPSGLGGPNARERIRTE